MTAAVLEISVFVVLLAGAIGFGAYLGERNITQNVPAQRQKRNGPGDERQVTPASGGGSPSACDNAATSAGASASAEVAADDLDDWFRDLWWTR